MELSQQVVSLELAKKLKELGVKQESYFYWVNPNLTEKNVTQLLSTDERFIDHHPDLYYSAFSVAELIDKMPSVNGSPFQLLKGYSIAEVLPKYFCRYDQLALHYSCMESFSDISSGNACAKMLIYLIENGMVKV